MEIPCRNYASATVGQNQLRGYFYFAFHEKFMENCLPEQPCHMFRSHSLIEINLANPLLPS